MEEVDLSLIALKKRFLSQYTENGFYSFYEKIYSITEEEFKIKFEKFYNKLIRSLKPDKNDDVDREIFEYDFMDKICNHLFMLFLHYSSGYELMASQYSEPIPAVLVYFNNLKEKFKKDKYLRKKSKEYGVPFYVIYFEVKRIRALLDSLFLQPTILLQIMRDQSSTISSQYRRKLKSKNVWINRLLPDAKYGKSMKGKKLHPQTKKMYERILELRILLSNQTHKKKEKSLLAAVREFDNINHKYWSEKKIMSIYETIRQLLKKNALKYPSKPNLEI